MKNFNFRESTHKKQPKQQRVTNKHIEATRRNNPPKTKRALPKAKQIKPTVNPVMMTSSPRAFHRKLNTRSPKIIKSMFFIIVLKWCIINLLITSL